MRLGALHMGVDSGNLGPQGLDAGLQLLDGQGVEVLPGKLHQRVAGLAREEVFQVHGVCR